MNFQDKCELAATLNPPTDSATTNLLEWVAQKRREGGMTAEETADLLFPLLFEGPLYERREVFTALQMVSTPEALLNAAFRAHQVQGFEGYLMEAASLLSTFGVTAWPAIRLWAQRGGADAEYLVETAFSVKGVCDAEYLAGLKDLVTRGDSNTRSRALGALHMLPERMQKELLSVMAQSGEAHDPSRQEAREYLAGEDP